MRYYKMIEQPVQVISKVTCDVCGTECPIEWGVRSLHIHQHWGYGSKKDLENWEADICEDCVDSKLGFINFKIKGSY